MTRVKITRTAPGGVGLDEWFDNLKDRIEDGNREVLEDGIEVIDRSMRDNIASRPTAWMAENWGKSGRIETHKMLNSVGHEVRSNTATRWTGAAGWVQTKEDYFLIQEEGGVNTFTGGRIEAMYAMRDAAASEWGVIQARIKENIENA